MKIRSYILSAFTILLFGCGDAAEKDKNESISEEIRPTLVYENIYSTTIIDTDAGGEPFIDSAIVNWIFSMVEKEEPVFYTDDEKLMSPEEVRERIFSDRLIQVEDPANPGIFRDSTEVLQVKKEDIIEILSLEDWEINEETNRFKKKVRYIAPVYITYDPVTGQPRAKARLFWVKI